MTDDNTSPAPRDVGTTDVLVRDAVRATLPTEHRYDASVYRTPLTMKTVKPMADRVDRLRHDLDGLDATVTEMLDNARGPERFARDQLRADLDAITKRLDALQAHVTACEPSGLEAVAVLRDVVDDLRGEVADLRAG